MRGRGRGRRHGGGPRRIRRFVEPALLLLLRRQPAHGYALMEGLNELGLEDYPVDFSAVYRTLRNLEEMGAVHSDWDLEASGGPPRRVYTITPEGEAYLRSWIEDLRATDRVLHLFLDAFEADFAEDESAQAAEPSQPPTTGE